MTKHKISIVIPAYNEQSSLPVLLPRIVEVIPPSCDYEIIVVDDGSRDNTAETVLTARHHNTRIHLISLSRNFGHQYALKAGLDMATGDCVITMDADLQHPPHLLPELIQGWQNGYDIVYTVRRENKQTPFLKRLSSRLYYRLFNFLTGLHLTSGSADFRLLDKRVVAEIKKLPERMLFLRGMISWMGFRQLAVPYTPADRYAGKSRYTWRKMFSLALTGATSFSLKPLRLAVYMGLTVAFLGCLLTAYVLYMRLFNGSVISGWASTLCVILILGGVQLLMMGIIGEYIGMIFMEAKRRPQYIISHTTLDGTDK